MTQRYIGLTGGIATGKSTVSNYLAQVHHLPILDADLYAREAVQTGTEVLQQIQHRYGNEILLADGSLNRSRLGEIIFNDPTERQWLEGQIHPYVRDQMMADLQTLSAKPIVVLVIPLLFEAKLTHLVSEIWVVSCPPSQQQQRLISRNNLSPAQAEARINSQMPLAEKCQQADIVIDNSQSLTELYTQVDRALQ